MKGRILHGFRPTVHTRIQVALTYKSPPKIRVRMWSKIIDPRITRSGFWGLVLDASLANDKLNRGLLFKDSMHRSPNALPLHRLQRHCDGRLTSRLLVVQWRRKPLPSTWPFTWPLMRNWDHGVSRMTEVGYGNLTVNKGRQWQESGVSMKNAWHHCCRPMTH